MFPEEIETERLRLRRLCRENVPTTRLYRHMRADAPDMGEVSEYVMWDPHETPQDTHEYLADVERQWDDREQATYAIFPREGERTGDEATVDETGTPRDSKVDSRDPEIDLRDVQAHLRDSAADFHDSEADPRDSEANPRDSEANPRDSETDPRDPSELAGTTNLHLDWERRSAELGIWLRKPFWGRGYSGERAAALMAVAFDRLDLEVVGASHQDGNDRSRRAIGKYVEAFGGQYDGLLRNFVPKGGEVRDLHRYTVTREQYREATRESE